MSTWNDRMGATVGMPAGAAMMSNRGIIPSGRLKLATDPTSTNTVVIGGHTFKFLTAPGAADTTTQVTRGAGAAAARALLIKAINGIEDAGIVPATSPHTLSVFADEVDTDKVRVRLADAKGGNPVAGTTSIAVSETLADVADVWDVANLNETGETTAQNSVAVGKIAITAAMITAGKAFIELPFTPSDVTFTVTDATGAQLVTSDKVTIDGNAVKISLAGGGAPALVATNIVRFTASN